MLIPKPREILHTTAGKTLAFMLLVGMFGGGVVMATNAPAPKVEAPPAKLEPLSVPLDGINAAEAAAKSSLILNGSLRINGGVVLKPSRRPTAPVIGQQYLDEGDKKFYYYNGTGWVALGPDEKILGLLDGKVSLQAGTPVLQSGNIGITGTVTAANIQGNGANITNISAVNVTSGTINNTRLSDEVSLLGQSIEGNEISAQTVTQRNLANGSVSTAKLVNGSVTNAKVGDGAITTGKLSDGAVTNPKLADGAVTNAKIAEGANISDTKLGTIQTPGKVADSALSPNVALLNRLNQTFTGNQTFAGTALFRNSVDSSTALLVQNAASGNLLSADTAANQVRIGDGSATTSADVTLFFVDSAPNPLLPTAGASLNGGIVYDSTNDKFLIVENGIYKEVCNKIDQGCGAAGVYNLQGAYTGGNTITTTVARDIAFTLANGSSFTTDVGVGSRFAIRGGAIDTLVVDSGGALTARNAVDSNSAFRVQDASGNDLILVNTATDRVTITGLQGSGALLTSLNASALATGTVDDARLSVNVTLAGNTFNGPNELIQATALGALPVISGANLTDLDAAAVATGTLDDARLSANVTLAGNVFNGISQLVQTDALGALPGISGANLTDLNATAVTSGTLDDARLSPNVALLDRDAQVFTGSQIFQNTVNSSDAFSVQSASGTDTLLKANTVGNRVVIGDADNVSSARTTLFVVDASSTANLPLGTNGGIVYDSTLNKFKVYENGQYKILCNATDLGCGDSGGAAVTLQGAYDVGNTILTAGNRDIAFTLASGDFVLQTAASDVLFKTDTVNNRLLVGNALASSGADSTLLVVDSATGSTLPAGVNGGIIYDSSLNKFKVYENGAYKILCNETDLGCAVAAPPVTLQDAYNNGNSIFATAGSPIFFQVASGAEFTIQGSTGDRLFVTDNGNNRVVIGNRIATTSTESTLFVVDAATTSNLPAGMNGGIIYDSTLEKLKIYENGAYKILCNTTDLGCGTPSAAITPSLQDVYNNSSEPAVISTTSPSKPIIFKAGANLDATTLFQIQNASGESLFNVDSLQASLQLNGANSGQLHSFQVNTVTLPGARRSAASVTAGGYIYQIGGHDGTSTTSTVYMAQVQYDGSVGPWTATTSLPVNRQEHGAVVSNGHVYVYGGRGSAGGAAVGTVYSARINPDKTLSSWTASGNVLPTAKANFGYFVRNGKIYAVGGNGAGTEVAYAAIQPNGEVGSWFTTTALPQSRAYHTSVTANGYAYVLGGEDAGVVKNTVMYARINDNGSIGAWQTSANTIPSVGRRRHASVAANGAVYLIGGDTAGLTNSVIFAYLGADGNIGTWKSVVNALPGNREDHNAVFAGGYIHVLGGYDGFSVQSTVFSASTARINTGGTLDLIGLGSKNLTDGDVGGNLIAGSTFISGTLDVTNQANFAKDLRVSGTTYLQGTLQLRPQTDSTMAFQAQTASGTTLLGVDTVGGRIFSTVADGAGAVGFVLDTPTYSASGAKLISLRSGGVEKFAIDKDGLITTASVQTASIVDGAVTPDKLSAQPAARVFHNAAQTLTTGAITALLFNSERFDNDTLHDTVTNTSRLTAGRAGIYAITSHVTFAGNTTGGRAVAIRLNGTTEIAKDEQLANGSNTTSMTVTTYYKLNAGDYVEVTGQQNSGGNLNVNTAGNSSPEFSMVWQSP